MGCTNSVAHGEEDAGTSVNRVNENNNTKKVVIDRRKSSTSRPSAGKKHSQGRQGELSNVNRSLNETKDEDEGFEEGSIVIDITSRLTNDEQYEEIIGALNDSDLFEDATFPADLTSMFFEPKTSVKDKIKWLRPYEILKGKGTPQLIKDGITRDDIKQGLLGDCWFLSSCAAVSQRYQLITKIIPPNQVLCGQGYKGIVLFRFWRFGEWVQVAVDDRLPTSKGDLIYGQSRDPTEFWVALIEKAYAKLHGTYEALEGGITMDALVDLTGGLAERYELTEYNSSMFRLMLRAHKSGAFIACSRHGDWQKSNKADANGLIPGHAYTVTDIAQIKHKMGEEKLLRIRNPWGDATEWRGKWSDNDVNWDLVDKETKDKIQQESKDDGEFWMSFKDFYKQFKEITLCLMGPDFDGDGVSDNIGHTEIVKGGWIIGKNAGGSRNNLASFASNDQFVLSLTEPDDFNNETDNAESEGKSNIVISLMQEHKKRRNKVKAKSHHIGFYIYKTDNPDCKLNYQHFRYTLDVANTNYFVDFREVSARFELDPGQYVIIPSTFKENCEAHYMLRIFGEKKFTLKGPIPS